MTSHGFEAIGNAHLILRRLRIYCKNTTVGKVYDYARYKHIAYLNVSRIIVKSTNFPRSGTTNDVGGMISANSRKNTVSDSKMDIERLT